MSALFLDKRFCKGPLKQFEGQPGGHAFNALVAAATSAVASSLELRLGPPAALRRYRSVGDTVAAAGLPRVEETEAVAARATTDAIPGGPTVRGAERNVKQELQAVLCKILRRPVTKADVTYAFEQVAKSPPMFKASVTVLGRTFHGGPLAQKKAAEHAAALEALVALVPGKQDTPAAAPAAASPAAGGAEDTVEGAGDAGVDYKGQLLSMLQTQGLRGAEAVRFETDRADLDGKVFVGRVVVTAESLGHQSFEGAAQARDAHESSAKARRAAEQDAARTALRALTGGISETADCTDPCGERVRFWAVRVPADPSQLLRPELLTVDGHGIFSATAQALGCTEVVPRPLQWAGDRPKGLCLYEAAGAAIAAPCNARAAALLGLLAETFRGDALLVEASVHSSGLTYRDVTGGRYGALRLEHGATLQLPSAALNASRGLAFLGHSELPSEYQSDLWVGQNPKTLLADVLRRRGAVEAPAFDVEPGIHQDCYVASFVLPAQLGQLVEGCAAAPAAGLRCRGRECRGKANAQQGAALKALQVLQEEQQKLGSASVALDMGGLLHVLETSEAARGAWNDCCMHGTVVALSYSLAVVPTELVSQGGAVPLDELLEVETCTRLRFGLGCHVLRPELEAFVAGVQVGVQTVLLSANCQYEQVACGLRLELTVHERSTTLASAQPGPRDELVVFKPPLREQRLDFVVWTLRMAGARRVVDLGCGEGQMLEALLIGGLVHVIGVDMSENRVTSARQRLKTVLRPDQTALVIQASMMELDARWTDMDALVASEVLEHLPAEAFQCFAAAVLGARPLLAIVTTPNADFGHGRLRHSDHERELTRAEFRAWAEEAAAAHDYELDEPQGVGELPGREAEGPCTQIAVFRRRVPQEACSAGRGGRGDVKQTEPSAPWAGPAVDVQELRRNALRSEVLANGLTKFVHREGVGEPAPPQSRITVHYATHLDSDGRRLDGSRDGRRETPCAFQLGGRAALPAWRMAAATMCCGELAWVHSSPEFAFGALGAPPLVPPAADLWFELEVMAIRPPGTVHFHKDFAAAAAEGERQLELGRGDVQRGAYAQGRQAFRRASAAVPDKLLLGRPMGDIERFATMERASLLNQALCSLRLGEAALEERAPEHFLEALAVSTRLIERYFCDEEALAATDPPANTSALPAVLRAAGRAAGCAWAAKAFFRRAVAREQLGYLTDALADLARARTLAPGDGEVVRRLEALRRRQRGTQLAPAAMFAGIFERERAAREQEEQQQALEEKRRRREERLHRGAAAATA